MKNRSGVIEQLRRDYRRLLDGVGDEQRFGQKLEDAQLTPSERDYVFGRRTTYAAELLRDDDPTQGGRRILTAR